MQNSQKIDVNGPKHASLLHDGCMRIGFVGVVRSASCILIRRDPVDANRVELEIAGMHIHYLQKLTRKSNLLLTTPEELVLLKSRLKIHTRRNKVTHPLEN